jgi:hypothetical protein
MEATRSYETLQDPHSAISQKSAFFKLDNVSKAQVVAYFMTIQLVAWIKK